MSAINDYFSKLSNEEIMRKAHRGVSYPPSNYSEPTTWESGASRKVSKTPNIYTSQSKIAGKWTPVDPTTDPNFVDNYRSVTQRLGSPARAWKTRGQERPNVDSETQAIMDRIKLPSYYDAIANSPNNLMDKYMEIYETSPGAAEKQFFDDAKAWDDDNFYYKLRAAQTLKTLPEKTRENALNSFNIDLNGAKKLLDVYINEKNYNDAIGMTQLRKGLSNLAKRADKALGDAMTDAHLRLTGQRRSYTDENGVKHTVNYSSGPADLDELANRLGNNDSTRLYSKSDYDENGNLTEEAKSRGPSSWNSKTTNSNGVDKRIQSIVDVILKKAKEVTQKAKDKADAKNSGLDGIAKAVLDKANEMTEKAKADAQKKKEEESGEVVEYTYKPGDTFGQVLLNLGLSDGSNLWGADGDVAYYTQQLVDQGVWPDGVPHNIPIGTTIKLKRRK